MLNLLSVIVVICFIVVSIAAPLLSPHDPNAQNLLLRLKPPFWRPGSAPGFPLGTDDLGRDVLSRVLFGSRISIIVGVSSACISSAIGTLIGLLAGYYGSAVDQITMRVADIQLAFPSILLALAIVAVVGGGLGHLIWVLGITGWVSYARVIRAEVLMLRESEYVLAAQIVGARDTRIMYRHLLPNVIGPIITIGTFQVAAAIVAEASLSFLGLGVPIEVPSWGGMLSEGQLYVGTAWWIGAFPGIAIMLVVLCINVLGDMLRDLFDPKTHSH